MQQPFRRDKLTIRPLRSNLGRTGSALIEPLYSAFQAEYIRRSAFAPLFQPHSLPIIIPGLGGHFETSALWHTSRMPFKKSDKMKWAEAIADMEADIEW